MTLQVTKPFADLSEIRAARDAYHKARQRVERITRAQNKLRDLHLLRASEHGVAKARYESLRDKFVDAALEREMV